ncbi:MAG: ArsR/SmtB family transcription factor [Candidatus Limnocylindria bacterium]
MSRDLPIDPKAIEAAERSLLSIGSERVARRLIEALCDPTRLKMLRALSRTPLAAGDLARVVRRSRAATSQHLRVLRDVEAVAAEREGHIVRYRLADSLTADVLEAIARAFDQLDRGAA